MRRPSPCLCCSSSSTLVLHGCWTLGEASLSTELAFSRSTLLTLGGQMICFGRLSGEVPWPAIPSTPAQPRGLSLDIVRWLQLRIPDIEENWIYPQTPTVGEDTDLLIATEMPGSHRSWLDTTLLKRVERQERIVNCCSRIHGVRTPKQSCYQEETEASTGNPTRGSLG